MDKKEMLLIDSITDQIEYYLYRVADGHVLSDDQKKHLRELRVMCVYHCLENWVEEIDGLLN